MGSGVDVGVDPDTGPGDDTQLVRDPGEDLELALRLHIEEANGSAFFDVLAAEAIGIVD